MLYSPMDLIVIGDNNKIKMSVSGCPKVTQETKIESECACVSRTILKMINEILNMLNI